jgi:hypothetical protein
MPMDSPSYRPLDDTESLTHALSELDPTSDEVADWMPIVQRLQAWPQSRVTSADNRHLLAVLAPLIPRQSPVRQAIAGRYQRRRGHLAWLLEAARLQIGILPPAFWLVSAVVTALGIWIELIAPYQDSTMILRALGPLLAYFGMSTAFRGIGLQTYESELACPVSPLQLALARLVIVLGYDVALGVCLSLALWLHALPGETHFFLVTLCWLMPLFLVAGMALILSLRLPSGLAAAIAYGIWLGALASWYAVTELAGIHLAVPYPDTGISFLPVGAELALGVVGLALLAVGTLRVPAETARLVAGI